HLGELVLHTLELADELAELLAHLGVVRRHLKRFTGRAKHFGAGTDRCALQRRLERWPGAALRTEESIGRHADILEYERRGSLRQVRHHLRANLEPGGIARHGDDGDTVRTVPFTGAR